jgi:hypothetical protein
MLRRVFQQPVKPALSFGRHGRHDIPFGNFGYINAGFALAFSCSSEPPAIGDYHFIQMRTA